LPDSLEHIRFGHDFNQSIDSLSDSVKCIIFGYSFNQVINKWPKSIRSVVFSHDFNQPVDSLPNSIIVIQLDDCEYINKNSFSDYPNISVTPFPKIPYPGDM
jgi:hypothetical protein